MAGNMNLVLWANDPLEACSKRDRLELGIHIEVERSTVGLGGAMNKVWATVGLLVVVLLIQQFQAISHEGSFCDQLDSWIRTSAKMGSDDQIRTQIMKAARDRQIVVTADDIAIERSDQRIRVTVRYRVLVKRLLLTMGHWGTHQFVAEPSPFESRLKKKFETEPLGRIKRLETTLGQDQN